MIPVMCMVKDDHEKGVYGDCVRACIASILELGASDVPHFFEQPDASHLEMQLWLRARGEIVAMVPVPGDLTLQGLTEFMAVTYPNQCYMLWCTSAGGDHAIVADATGIVHNPAWFKSPIDGPHSSGFWLVWIIAKL